MHLNNIFWGFQPNPALCKNALMIFVVVCLLLLIFVFVYFCLALSYLYDLITFADDQLGINFFFVLQNVIFIPIPILRYKIKNSDEKYKF